jgi:hypothetical protein
MMNPAGILMKRLGCSLLDCFLIQLKGCGLIQTEWCTMKQWGHRFPKKFYLFAAMRAETGFVLEVCPIGGTFLMETPDGLKRISSFRY